jgi:general secretion pathway protein G
MKDPATQTGARRFGPVEIVCILVLLVVVLYRLNLERSGHTTDDPGMTVLLSIDNIETAVENFYYDTGQYPTGTNALQQLMSPLPGTTNWHGPYLQKPAKDPWGNDYVYVFPAPHATARTRPYDVFSLGPPGKNTPIGNWPVTNR